MKISLISEEGIRTIEKLLEKEIAEYKPEDLLLELGYIPNLYISGVDGDFEGPTKILASYSGELPSEYAEIANPEYNIVLDPKLEKLELEVGNTDLTLPPPRTKEDLDHIAEIRDFLYSLKLTQTKLDSKLKEFAMGLNYSYKSPFNYSELVAEGQMELFG